MRTLRALAWTCGLGIVAACRGASDGGAVAADDVPRWSVQETFRIGSVDDPDESLVSVGEVRIGADGRLYVLQAQDDQFRIYDAAGGLLGRFGRAGEGPGEFGAPGAIGLSGDTLYVTDRSLNRISFFNLDGDFLTSAQWPSQTLIGETSFMLAGAPQVLLEDGSGISAPLYGYMRGEDGDGPRTQTLARAYLRTWLDGTLDTLATYEQSTTTNTVPTPGGGTIRLSCPWGAWDIGDLMIDGGGAVVIRRDPSAAAAEPVIGVTRVSPAGDTVFDVAIPYDPVPLDGGETQRRIEEIRAAYVGRGDPVPAAGDVEAAFRDIDCIPSNHVPVTELVTAQDGTIWLAREDTGGETLDWDVLAPDGTRIGRLPLRAGEEVAAVRDDRLVTTWTDPLGVPYLTVYRLTR